jgi:cytochrome c oxidase cbb3-type subunit 3
VKRQLTDSVRHKKAMVLIPLGVMLSTLTAQAQAAAGAGGFAGSGMGGHSLTIALLALIGIEFLLILFFSVRIMDLLKPADPEGAAAHGDVSLWQRIQAKWAASNFVPLDKEAEIDLNHDYDGIRELDNVIPPWFTAAFALTVLFAGVYIYRYHIARSAPMQIEELRISMAKADLEHEAYLASQASSIDENSVTMMTGADLDAGKQVFTTLCAVCHKTDGGGLVGPNMTDDYWIHGGSLKDIFKTIKYGVPDKGMISWKTQLSPVQIAQVSNYIKTLQGTNPPDAKEKQGVLYVESAEVTDTTAASVPVQDTTGITK